MNNRLKKKLEPFKIDHNNNLLKIENTSSFLKLSNFKVIYEIVKMSKVIEKDILKLNLNPGEMKEFRLNIKSNLNENLPYYLNIYIVDNDTINSFNQFLLKDENKITYHIDIDNFFNDIKVSDSIIELNDFLVLDIDKLELIKENKSSKSIDYYYKNESYDLVKYIMRSKDNRLSIRYTFNTKSSSINKLGYKIKFNKDIYNKLLYFGDGPDNSDKYIKVGLDSLYSVNLTNELINRSNVRIVSLLDKLNHGIRIEYADFLFNIEIIESELYINIRDEYREKIKDLSEYSFETIIDIV